MNLQPPQLLTYSALVARGLVGTGATQISQGSHLHDDRYYTETEISSDGTSSVHWNNLTNVPPLADDSWKTPVATVGDLPAASNEDGDIRLVLDTDEVYLWDVDHWELVGNANWAPLTHTHTLFDNNLEVNGVLTVRNAADDIVNVFDASTSTLYGTMFVRPHPEYGTNGIYINTDASWGGWARNLLSIAAEDNTQFWNIGGYGGSGTTFSYGYVGTAYNDTWQRWYPATGYVTFDGSVGIGTTIPNAKLDISRTTVDSTEILRAAVLDGTYKPRFSLTHATSVATHRLIFNSSYAAGTGYADWIFQNGGLLVADVMEDGSPTDISTMPSGCLFYLSGATPGIKLRIRRETGGFAASLFDLSVEDTSSSTETAMGGVGIYGGYETDPTPPTCHYMFFGCENDWAYNENTFKLYPDKKARFEGEMEFYVTDAERGRIDSNGLLSLQPDTVNGDTTALSLYAGVGGGTVAMTFNYNTVDNAYRSARIGSTIQGGGGGNLFFQTAPAYNGAWDTKMTLSREGTLTIPYENDAAPALIIGDVGGYIQLGSATIVRDKDFNGITFGEACVSTAFYSAGSGTDLTSFNATHNQANGIGDKLNIRFSGKDSGGTATGEIAAITHEFTDVTPGAVSNKFLFSTTFQGTMYDALEIKKDATNTYINIVNATDFLRFQFNGSNKFSISQTGYMYCHGVTNSSTGNNATILVANTGTEIYRNVADATPALQINQARSGVASTGDIVQFQFDDVVLSSIDVDGGLHIGATVNTNVSSITSAYTAGSEHIILASASTIAFTVTLPAASGLAGREYTIKKTDSTVYAITIDANSTETIDGELTYILSNQYDSVTLVCDGSNWYVV